VAIDRPQDRRDGPGYEDDGVRDEQLTDYAESVADDGKPREPRTRQQYADDLAQPDEGPKPNPESAESDEIPDREAPHDDDRVRPLTDKEWAEHVAEVREGLDQARREGLETHLLYTIDPDHQSWSKDRRELHKSIIRDLYAAAHDVPNEGCAIIAGGLGGAGKTTILTEHAGIDPSQYLIINPDNIKEEMARRDMIPGVAALSPMEASDLVHEESSYLARQLALRAHADRKNLIWDVTMSAGKSTAKRINELSEAGYTRIDGLFVDIPVETSVRRTDSRHRDGHDLYRNGDSVGGRYVPPEVIKHQEDPEWGSKNKRNFYAVKKRFNDWSIYDNSADGRRAVLVESARSRRVS
jgi:predicted ABC-type ATPase